MRQISHPRHDPGLSQPHAAPQGIADQRFHIVYGHAHAYAREMIDVMPAAGGLGNFSHYLLHEQRNRQAAGPHGKRRHLLAHDGHLLRKRAGIVRAHLSAEAVFQRRDDAAAAGVVFGVGGCDNKNIKGQVELVAPDLHVALLQQIKKPHLNFFMQVGQFVYGKDAPVGAGDKAVVDDALIGEMPAFGNLDGIDIADKIGYGHIRRGELFAVAKAAVQPCNRGPIPEPGNLLSAVGADGRQRIVIYFAALQNRQPFIQQVRKAAHDAGFALAALAKENNIVARQDGVFQLRYDRVFIADDAGEQVLAGAYFCDKVLLQLGLYAAALPARALQIAQRFWKM